MTEAEIDEFLDDALVELEEIRIDAKEGASRGSFALSYFPKVCLSRLRPAFLGYRMRSWNVRSGSLADITAGISDVRFTPEERTCSASGMSVR